MYTYKIKSHFNLYNTPGTVKPVYNDTAYNDKPVYNDNCISPVNKGYINIQLVYNDNLRITICFLGPYSIVTDRFYCI